MKLWIKIFVALFLGVLIGLLLGEKAVYLKPLGTLFLNLINMVIPLLILSSMTAGITAIQDPKKLSRIGAKTLGIYLTTTLIAIFGALFLANLFHLGEGLKLQASFIEPIKKISLTEILLSIFPSNPVAALVNGNILQLIVFAVFLGSAINLCGSKGKPLLFLMQSLSDVMYRLTSLIMNFSPVGIFGIMAWVTGTFGFNLLFPLIKFLSVYYLACFLHFFIVYGSLLKGFSKLDFIPFIKGMAEAILFAFSTGSSVATLPVALHCTQKNLGASENISAFVFPLGITVNMNGTVIFQAMSAVFIAKAYGIILLPEAYLTLVLTTTLSAIGTAGVPGGGFLMLSAVLTSVGLPLEGLALLIGIDRLREMLTTVLNILGDAAVTVAVAKQEGELNEKQYYHTEQVKFESKLV